jgi:hypothetical protein
MSKKLSLNDYQFIERTLSDVIYNLIICVEEISMSLHNSMHHGRNYYFNSDAVQYVNELRRNLIEITHLFEKELITDFNKDICFVSNFIENILEIRLRLHEEELCDKDSYKLNYYNMYEKCLSKALEQIRYLLNISV